MSNTIKINLLLSALLIAMSVLSIVWQHQNRDLYLRTLDTEKQHRKITALNKQLLSEYSRKDDGLFIKNKAKKLLKMQQLTNKNKREIDL